MTEDSPFPTFVLTGFEAVSLGTTLDNYVTHLELADDPDVPDNELSVARALFTRLEDSFEFPDTATLDIRTQTEARVARNALAFAGDYEDVLDYEYQQLVDIVDREPDWSSDVTESDSQTG